MVTVKFNSALKNFSPGNKEEIELECYQGLTVRELLVKFNLHLGQVCLVLIDGKVVKEDHKLSPGDVVELYPIFGGG